MSVDDARDAALRDAALRAGQLLGAVVARVQDVLPVLDTILDEVRQAWPDAAGRVWADRADLVRRGLLRDLDDAVAAARAAETLARTDPPAGSHVTDGGPYGRSHGPADGGAEPGPTPGGPAAGARSAGGRAGRSTGPRLGDTAADRTDDEQGMRIATLGEPG